MGKYCSAFPSGGSGMTGGGKSVRVTGTDELQKILHSAQENKTPVSLYRKAKPDGIALDFSEWKDIEVLDIDNLMAIVPPGTLLGELNDAAGKKGLRFIPADTPAYDDLSMGEWVYRGCPNPSVWKYGAGKHFLLGGSYVLPNGDMTPVGGQCIKNVTGYDFTRFLAGAYADLAIGVQYIIKLMPQPAFRKRYDMVLPSLTNAIELIDSLHSRPIPPAWLFWADETAGSKLFGHEQKGHRILFELDGNEVEVRDYEKAVCTFLASAKGGIAEETSTIPSLSGLENSTDGFWLLDELKVPYTQMESFTARSSAIFGEKRVMGGLFGQLAEGKVQLFLDMKPEQCKDIITALQAAAGALGGASSGKYKRLYEHGMNSQLAALENAFRKQIDPHQIFNQGGIMP